MAHLLIKDTVIADRRLPLPGRVVVVGRSLDVDIPVPHASVSRRHALIEASDGGFLLSDLGSRNGTFVGDDRLGEGERREISLGTLFRVGEVLFRICPDEVLENAPAPGPLAAAPAPSAPVVSVKAAPKSRPSAAPAKKTRARAKPALRATKRREREVAMKWLGVLVTVALVALAGIFLAKIVGMSNGDEKPTAEEQAAREEEETRKKRESWEIKTLVPPWEKDKAGESK